MSDLSLRKLLNQIFWTDKYSHHIIQIYIQLYCHTGHIPLNHLKQNNNSGTDYPKPMCNHAYVSKVLDADNKIPSLSISEQPCLFWCQAVVNLLQLECNYFTPPGEHGENETDLRPALTLQKDWTGKGSLQIPIVQFF